MKRHHPYKLWSQYTRRQQRAKWISLRWKITQASRTGGHGLYWTQEDESSPPANALCNQWTDIYVPALDGHTIWNMYLTTVRSAMWEAAEDLARTRIEQCLTPAERAESLAYLRHCFSFTRIPGTKSYEMNLNQEEPSFVSLAGQTKRHATELETRKIIESGELNLLHPIQEGWEFAHDYAYGVGVNAIVAASQLTPETISAFVQRFLANTPFRGELPPALLATSSKATEHAEAHTSIGFAQSRALKC